MGSNSKAQPLPTTTQANLQDRTEKAKDKMCNYLGYYLIYTEGEILEYELPGTWAVGGPDIVDGWFLRLREPRPEPAEGHAPGAKPVSPRSLCSKLERETRVSGTVSSGNHVRPQGH